jgi:hypothetical protein
VGVLELKQNKKKRSSLTFQRIASVIQKQKSKKNKYNTEEEEEEFSIMKCGEGRTG